MHNNYGRITQQQIDDKKTTAKSMIYDPDETIYIMFNALDDLVEYARAAEAELTQIHTINLALFILNRKKNSKSTSGRGNIPTRRTKHRTILNMTSVKLALNSEKPEEQLTNWASTMTTPWWIR